MIRPVLALFALLLIGSLGFCTREDGLPDPPAQQLVPCEPDAGADDPLVCPARDALPPSADAGADASSDL